MTLRTRSVLTSLSLAACAAALLVGCPSKEGEQKDAQAAGTSGGGGTSAPAQGPLAGLESEKTVAEAWTIDGQPAPMIYFDKEDVRVSASCQKAPGQLACDALRQLRVAAPVEIPRRFLDGRQSAGVNVCAKLGHPTLVGKNPMGSEDSFCKFPDGSMVSSGALERYAMRVME